jgi:kinesin family protein 18/19
MQFVCVKHPSPARAGDQSIMANADAASSISVTVRVRPFTVREAAQLTKCDDGPLFLGDGSLAAVPTPKLTAKGLRSVIKVVDDRCLYDDYNS